MRRSSQPTDPVRPSAQRGGVVEQPEAVAGGDEQQHDEDTGEDRRRVTALAAQDERSEAGGEQGEEHEVGERVLEDHRDEHQGVGHAALLQHAVGDGCAAHSAGGEEVGGGQPGEVDAQGEAQGDRCRRSRAGGGRATDRRAARRTRRRRRRPATPAWRPAGASSACAWPASRGRMRNSVTMMTRKIDRRAPRVTPSRKVRESRSALLPAAAALPRGRPAPVAEDGTLDLLPPDPRVGHRGGDARGRGRGRGRTSPSAAP